MKLEIITNIKGGKMQPKHSRMIVDYIQLFEGKAVHITVDKHSGKRSHRQNAYLHLIFTIFTNALNELGNTFRMEEVKEMIKAKFALVDVYNVNTGECIGQRIKGTSEMSKVELIEFIDKFIAYAADEFHVVLPHPNEQIEIFN